jgi:hypothetical protein
LLRRFLTVAVLLGVVLLTPSFARAQNLANLLTDLIQTDVFLAPPTAPGFQNHSAHFVPGPGQQIAPYYFNQELLSQLATVPLGSSSGGFSYTFDPTGGTFQRATVSFGPTFAERALTNGKGKFTFGGNFQYSKYTSFEGTDLENGDLKFYLRHAPQTPPQFFEGDLVEAALKLKVSSSTTTFFGSYGVTDKFDVAISIPLEHVSMDATVDATILRLATAAIPAIHSFPTGDGTHSSYAASGSASGVGDILVRGKYRLFEMNGGGIAGNVDIRLPSGKAENLLGTGAVAGAFTVIGSSVYGRFAPHFNIGYTVSGQGDVVQNVPNEVGYRFGTEVIATPRATLAVDFLGRTLLNAGRVQFVDTKWDYTTSANVAGSTMLHELARTSGALNLSSVALGGKFNINGNLLLSGNLLVAVGSSGITARVTPVIGLEYSF